MCHIVLIGVHPRKRRVEIRKMNSLKITHSFDVIKKEIKYEDEQITPVTYDQTDVKQEYHYKEELDLAWDEKDNDLGNKENIHHTANNSIRKLDYPIVLLERLRYDTANNFCSVQPYKDRFKALSVQEDNNKLDLLQHYHRVYPTCNKTKSYEKDSSKCKYCNQKWNYECKKCMKRYSNQTSIIYHLKSKCLKKGYYFACFECDYKSVKKYAVNQHLKHAHSIFDALNCIEKFESNNVQKDTAAKLHKCSKCGEEFKKLTPLLRHMQICGQPQNNTSSNNSAETPTVVKDRSVYYCAKCNKTMKVGNVDARYQKRCQTCNLMLSFKCKECNKCLSTRGSMYRHLKWSHVNSDDVLKCHQCDYKTLNIVKLTSHVAGKHSAETHECKICGRKYKSRNYLRIHLRDIHAGKQFRCDTCSYQSKSKRVLKGHIINMHTKGDHLECPKCKKYVIKENLEKHKKYCGNKDFKCYQCGHRSMSKNALAHHIKNMHSEGNETDCPKCGKTFKNKNYMRSHLSKYCGKDYFQCDFCSHKTRYQQGLKRHIQLKHSKSKGPHLE